jgi:osmotically inducible lipoprotein OsmB
MKERITGALRRARYAAIGGALGGALGGLISKNAASTGAATGALLGAVFAEKRSSAGNVLSSLPGRSGDDEADNGGGVVDKVKAKKPGRADADD